MQPDFLSGMPPEVTHHRANPAGQHPVRAFESGEAPSFWDVLDVINPLQHLPIIGTIYRAVTGDEIGAVPRLAGGTLYGGPLGFGAAVVDIAMEGTTGGDMGERVLAMIGVGDEAQAASRVAANEPAPAPDTMPRQPAREVAAAPGPSLPDEAFMPVPSRALGLRTAAVMPQEPHVVTTAQRPAPPAEAHAAAAPAEPPAVDPERLRLALRAQGFDDVQHPFLPPEQKGAEEGWLVQRMKQALDAYGRTMAREGTGG